MAIVITPYEEHHAEKVRSFNARMAGGGVDFVFPEWLPEAEGRNLFQRYFLAVENGDVRGGYILKYQDFSFCGDTARIAFYRLPLSEGVLDRRYSGLGIQMLRTALKQEPQMYCLGMGGEDRPLPRMLKALHWGIWPVPFYFKVYSSCRFFSEVRALRGGPARNFLLYLARCSGGGWAALKAAQWFNRTRNGLRGDGAARIETFSCFSSWADELWNSVKARYAMSAVRDAAVLNVLYPASDARFMRLRFSAGHRTVGWAVVLDTLMRDHKQFGNLRVGSIIDCLADPADTRAVVAGAARFLAERGVDLVVSNQMHAAWAAACATAGFLRGPSNYLFAASPELSRWLAPLPENRVRIHMTRGDGDGPIHL